MARQARLRRALLETAAASGNRQRGHALWRKLAERYDLGMLCVTAGSPNGYDSVYYNWELACTKAAAQDRVMDRANYRVMAPLHIAETREKAIENVRAGFGKWQLYSCSTPPFPGALAGDFSTRAAVSYIPQ